jgi:hypothetical protein
MKKLYKGISAILFLLLSFPAMAMHCPADLKKIDAALGNSSISAADMTMVKELRASGEKYHKTGKHKDSVDDLAKAMKLLGI